MPRRQIFKNVPNTMSKPRTLDKQFPYPFTCFVEVDVLLWLVVILMFCLRSLNLETQPNLIFDEPYVIGAINSYANGTFSVETQPPLGYIFLSFWAWICEHQHSVGDNFPSYNLRLVCVVLGCLVGVLLYQVLKLSISQRWSCILGLLFVALDTVLIAQSRMIGVQTLYLVTALLNLCALLKLRDFLVDGRLNSLSMWFAAGATGFLSGCSVAMNYIGAANIVLNVIVIGVLFWPMIAKSNVSVLALTSSFLGFVFNLLVLPTIIYLVVFAVQLSIKHKASPADELMSTAFQASLQDSLLEFATDQPSEVSFGSHVTLKMSKGRKPCWLHSHHHVYPLKYPDGRGSTHQQQVTCYPYKDRNNWWLIQPPEMTSLKLARSDVTRLQHSDVIRLQHGVTGRYLSSHDVAAPESPGQQEVSGYIDYNVSFPARTHWRLIVDGGGPWWPLRTQIRLQHLPLLTSLASSDSLLSYNGAGLASGLAGHTKTVQNDLMTSPRNHESTWRDDPVNGSFQETQHNASDMSAMLKVTDNVKPSPSTDSVSSSYSLTGRHFLAVSGKQLPKWGFRQLEVVAASSKLITTAWTLEEHRRPDIEINGTNEVKVKTPPLNLFARFLELQFVMLNLQETSPGHRYSSTPTDWLLGRRGIALWADLEQCRQVYLLPHLFLCLFVIVGLVAALSCQVFNAFYLRRYPGYYSDETNKALAVIWIFSLGFLLNFVPFFFVERTLFLHHYLPAYIFALLLSVKMFDLYLHRYKYPAAVSAFVLVVAVWWMTWKLSPLVYGLHVSKEAAAAFSWRESWDIMYCNDTIM